MKIIAVGKQTMVWRENVYSKLIKAAKNALEIGIPSSIRFYKISIIPSLLGILL